MTPKLTARFTAFMRFGFACVLVAAAAIYVTAPAYAHVRKIQITAKDSPAFGGYSWPGVGQYEKIVGKAFGELDPNDPKNAIIVDLRLAPRNANGKVEYRRIAAGKRSARSIVESAARTRAL